MLIFLGSFLTKEKNGERFRKNEKFLGTTDCADDADKFPGWGLM